MRNCVAAGLTTITGSGGAATVEVDGSTMQSLNTRGVDLVSATMSTVNSNLAIARTVNGNIAAATLHGGATSLHSAEGLYVVSAVLEQITAGTSGTAVVNVGYTDMNGNAQTQAVTAGLTVSAVPGTKDRGVVSIAHNGSTAITYSITGVGTADSWATRLKFSAMRTD
jgi:hypothetical protein